MFYCGFLLVFTLIFPESLVNTSNPDACQLEDPECFPVEENQFGKLLINYDDDVIEQNLNEFCKEKDIFKKKIKFKKSNIGVAPFAYERIRKEELFMEVKSRDTYSAYEFQELMLRHKELRKLDFKFNEDQLFPISADMAKAMFALHYHFAHINESKFKGDLIGMPKRIYSPLFILPYKSLEYLPPSDSDGPLALRKKLKEWFKSYEKEVTAKLEPSLLDELFGKIKISFPNFAYLYFIGLTRGLAAYTNSFAITPCLHYVNSFDTILYETDKNSFKYRNGYFGLKASKTFEIGEELRIVYQDTSSLDNILNHGFDFKENERDCENLHDQKFLKTVSSIYGYNQRKKRKK